MPWIARPIPRSRRETEEGIEAVFWLPAEEIDTCPSMEEVTDLLPSDFLWREADTFFYNAVVGGEDNVLRMFQGGG